MVVILLVGNPRQQFCLWRASLVAILLVGSRPGSNSACGEPRLSFFAPRLNFFSAFLHPDSAFLHPDSAFSQLFCTPTQLFYTPTQLFCKQFCLWRASLVVILLVGREALRLAAPQAGKEFCRFQAASKTKQPPSPATKGAIVPPGSLKPPKAAPNHIKKLPTQLFKP